MLVAIMDLEADALLDTVTLIHCMCISIYEGNQLIGEISLTDYNDMIDALDRLEAESIILVGHNIKRYDLPVIQKILDYTFNGNAIDTLGLSWYLHPEMEEHGLEVWGEILRVAKPSISDWVNLSIADYLHRCSTDVVINTILFGNFLSHLQEIYGEEKECLRIMYYLTWKLDCAAEQEANPLTVNRVHCKKHLDIIVEEIEARKAQLALVMPPVVKYVEISKPAKMFKKDGKLSVVGENWLQLLSENNLEADYEGVIRKVKSSIPPNPTSIPQLKSWLFTLGWTPTIYKHVVDENTKAVRQVPQLQDKDKRLCLNIVMLAIENPALQVLEGLFMLQHRRGVFESFLENSTEDGKMIASINGFTNTLRFKHKKPIANLPGVDKPYGKEIRGAIIAPTENHLFCGSDMSSLEDTTKQHYMYFYDPEYVKAMRVPGFDPHLDIGVLANLMSKEDSDRFKYLDKQKELSTEEKAEMAKLKKIRAKAKIVNFSGIYGAGPPKIALTTGMSLQEATLLHTIYWQRNKAVKQISNDCVTKKVRNSFWLYNPVSHFWYSLRKPKDAFSTLNQGTGVYCFDIHIKNVRQSGIKISLQYHDEIGFPFEKQYQDLIKNKLNQAIIRTNEMLKLNVPLGISIDIGNNYAESH